MFACKGLPLSRGGQGPYFPPLYESLPDEVHFYYDGKPMKLSLDAEEVWFLKGKVSLSPCP